MSGYHSAHPRLQGKADAVYIMSGMGCVSRAEEDTDYKNVLGKNYEQNMDRINIIAGRVGNKITR